MKKLMLSIIIILSTASFASADNGTQPYTDPYYIAPAWGKTETFYDYYMHYHGQPGRAVQHLLYWGSDQPYIAYQDMTAYRGLSPSGMEIDFNLDGYDSTNVWGYGAASELQSDKGDMWFSDLPYAYIDTSFSDKTEEPGIGVGSGNWQTSKRNYTYYAGGYLQPGPTHYDDYKVRVSRTHKHDFGFYGGACDGGTTNAWCRFEDGPSFEAIPSWKGHINAALSTYTWNNPKTSPYDSPFVSPIYRNKR